MSLRWILSTAPWRGIVPAMLVIVLCSQGVCEAAADEYAQARSGDVFVDFSFKDIRIPTFVEAVGEITGQKFVISDGVNGEITVVSPKVRLNEVYPLAIKVLESAGCSVVVENDVNRIVTMPEQAGVLAPVIGADDPVPAVGVITKIFRLEHVSVQEFQRLLESMVSGGRTGAVGAIRETNHLVLTDTSENVRRVEKMIGEIDQPGLAFQTDVVHLKFASANELAVQLMESVADRGMSRGDKIKQRIATDNTPFLSGGRNPFVVAAPHSNSLILAGSTSQLEQMKKIIAKVDIDSPSGRGHLKAIRLKYLKADDAAENLNALLNQSGQGKATDSSPRRISIQASPANNALLVDAAPGDFSTVKELIEFLDTPPEQVYIEVVIAELTEGDSLDLGVNMAAIDMPDLGKNVLQGSSFLGDNTESLMSAIQQGVFPGGLSVGVAHGSRVDAEGNLVVSYPGLLNINAVKRDSRFRIMSTPSLTAQNNEEASVMIVNEIPVETSTIEGGSGSSRDVIQNLERIPVGIKLNLTPHIIEGGQVRMELKPSIEAVTDPGPEGRFAPTIAKRSVETVVTVADGEMIVIAGLTRNDRVSSVRKIPILGSLPLLGWLFRNTTEADETTNVLIFVTPVIVRDAAVAAEVTQRLSDRTGLKANEER